MADTPTPSPTDETVLADPVKSKKSKTPAFTPILDQLGLRDINWSRQISLSDIDYFYRHMPFLQISTFTESVEEFKQPRIETSPAGWTIINYGDALSTAAGCYLYGCSPKNNPPKNHPDDDDDGEGERTLQMQTFLSAAELIRLAKEMGWQDIHIVDANIEMAWAAWLHAEENGLTVSNYSPSNEDMKKRERLKRSELQDQLRSSIRSAK